MAKRRRSGTRTFPKRATLWVPFDDTLTVISATSPVEGGNLLTAYFAQTGEEVPIGSTIGPIRGIIALFPNSAATFSTAFGIEAVLQLVKEGGRTQTASPKNDILDAMWYGQMMATSNPTEISSGVFNQTPTVQPFVTKAMRKITGNGQELIVTAVSNDNTDYNVRVTGNLMIRLP